MPSEWDFYSLSMTYELAGLDDLEFTRESLSDKEPYKELDFGFFSHKNDLDPHPDMNACGHLKAIITKEGIGFALDLENGPLPRALEAVFPAGLQEVKVGEIPGYKRGRAPKKAKKKSAKKKRAAKKRKR